MKPSVPLRAGGQLPASVPAAAKERDRDQERAPGQGRDRDVVLGVSDLSVDYLSSAGAAKAVDRVSFDLHQSEFLAVVGESGCGKSTLLFAIAHLLSPPAEVTGGKVVFSGQNIVAMSEKKLRALRWRGLSVVMQSAMNALNPVSSIGAQFADALRAHGESDHDAVRSRSRQVLSMVGIDPVHLSSYPHQLSGGMRQRAMIAMALLFSPELILMDEPTSALDVVAQRSLMVQVKQLQSELGFAIIFVTHDMSLVSHFSDRVAVMYAGQVVEARGTKRLFDNPLHPYTRGLLEAFPSVYGPKVPLQGIPGSPPDLANLPVGCNFSPRCPEVMPRCRAAEPPLYQIEDAQVRCVLYDGGASVQGSGASAPGGGASAPGGGAGA
ncbi:MAG: ABC transporter ATP-binding protein [Acidimicrobiales bacterium]